MVSHYTAIVFISVISMFIMIFGAESNTFMPIKQKRRFQLLFFLLILSNLAEWVAASINGDISFFRIIHIFAKFIEFILAPVIPIVCSEAIDGDKNTKLMIIPLLINAVLQILSLFTGIIFEVDSGNVYHRGIFYYLYISLVACSVLFLLVHCLQFGQRYQFNNILFLFLILLLVVGITITQLVASQLRLDWTCVSIAAIMFYIYYDQLVQQVDDMTKLLNRRSYNCRIENFNQSASILFFDVDNFKYVNDTYGHGFGDECLITISLELRKVFEKYGKCYRFGGDEFCVMMTRNIENTEELISKYLRKIEDIRKREIRLPSISVGYVLFNPDTESIYEAIDRADKIMYKVKDRT